MNTVGVMLFAANLIAFLIIGFVFLIRLREAKGSLRLAKICIAMTCFSAVGAFLLNIVTQLIYNPSDPENLLIKQVFVPENLFAMLVMAFLASFAVFATYSGGKRKLITLSIFIVALIPTAYLMLKYSQATVTNPLPDEPESYHLVLPELAMALFALCGIPLGIIPVVAFSRSLVLARKRGDKVLSHGAAMMLSAVVFSLIGYILYVFPLGILRLVSLIVLIPSELFLLFVVLKTTRQVKI
jgi:hypothetical protein